MWRERTAGGLPTPGVATAMVHTHLQGPSLCVLGLVLVLRRAVSRVGVNTHTVTPVPTSHLMSELGDGNRYLSPFEYLSCRPKSSFFWFSSLSVLGQVLLVFNPLPEFCRSRDGEMETEEKKKSSKFLLAEEL